MKEMTPQEMQQEIIELKQRLSTLEGWTEALLQGICQYLQSITGTATHVIAGNIRSAASKISKEPNRDK